MAYDEALAEQIRALTTGERGLSEKKMFGGLAFLVNGNMAVAASGQGGLLVHVDAEEGARLVETTDAVPMEMRGRRMAGWLRVDPPGPQVAEWVERGVGYARTLPPKR